MPIPHQHQAAAVTCHILPKLRKFLNIAIILFLILIGLSIVRVRPTRAVYGHFAGEFIGNCGTMYEVTSKEIHLDTSSYWKAKVNSKELKVAGQSLMPALSGVSYSSYILKIPLIMVLDPRSRFGCPDCLDQGGHYFEFTMFGLKRYFEIERGREPFYYPGLTLDIDSIVSKLALKFSKYGR